MAERVASAVLELTTGGGLLQEFEQIKGGARGVDSEFEKLRRRTQGLGQELARTVERFEGRPLIEEARRVAQAVEKIGGVGKLTKSELTDVTKTVTAATDKLRRMGEDVPPSLRKLEAELKAVGTGGAKASGGIGEVVKSLGPLSTLLPALSAASLVGGLAVLARDAFQAAGEITDLANRTGFSTDAIQEMREVANQTGSDLSTFTDAAFRLGVRIGEGTTKARNAVRELGLSYAELREMRPEDQFRTVIAALEGVDSITERNRLGTALFGEQFSDIAASVEEGYTAIADAASKSSREQLDALDAAGDAWQKFKDDAAAATVSILGNIVLAAQQLGSGIADLTPDERSLIAFTKKSGGDLVAVLAQIEDAHRRAKEEQQASTGATEHASQVQRNYVQELADAKREVEALSGDQRTQLNAALEAGAKAAQEYADRIGLSGLALTVYQDQVRAAEAGSKKLEAAQQALADLQRSLFGEDVIAKAASYATALGDVENVSQLTTAKKAELRAAVEAALTAYRALGRGAPEQLGAILLATQELLTSTRALSFAPLVAGARSAEEAANAVGASLRDLPSSSLRETAEATAEADAATRQWATTTGGLLAPALEDSKVLIREVRDEARTLAQTLEDSLLKTLQAVPEALASAFVHGGDVGGAVKSLTSKLGSDLAKWGAAALGVTGPWGQAIAGAVGSLAPLISRLWGGASAEVRKARDEVKKFQEDLAKTLTPTQRAAAGTEQWRMTLVAVTDAYAATGRSAAAAEAIVRQLWDTDHPDRARAAMEEINRVLEEQQALLAANQASAQTLFDEIMTAGAEGIPAAYRPAIEQLIALGLLTDEQAAKLRGLADSNAINTKQMEDDLAIFQGRVESLGPAFQQAKLDETAMKYVNAIDRMIKSGADVGGVLFDAKEELGALVSEALKSGKTPPANLKPWIEDLVRSGNLIDENGEKITDVSGLKWGEAQKTEAEVAQEGWDRILAKIQELIDRVAGPVNDAIDQATRDRTLDVDVNVREHRRRDGESSTQPANFADGIFRGQFDSAGTLARLHNIESVVPRHDELAFASRILAERGQTLASSTTNNTPLFPVFVMQGESPAVASRRFARWLSTSGLPMDVEAVRTSFERVIADWMLSYGPSR
ncbi:MAG: hypothetical protein AB7O32_00520 [Vicinamibacterales bacterium]